MGKLQCPRISAAATTAARGSCEEYRRRWGTYTRGADVTHTRLSALACAPKLSSHNILHERLLGMRRPLSKKVQAPHCPRSQPFLEPLSPSPSRSAASSVVQISTES